MGGATRMGDSDVINSHAPFSPCLLSLSSPSTLPLPPSLPLSSALAQDHINIPLKPVSTAARSPCPSLTRTPFPSSFCSPFSPSCFFFVFRAIVF